MIRTHAQVRKPTSRLRRVTLPPSAAKSHPATVAQVHQILHGPRLQPKLTVGTPNDAFEREADRVAEDVMRMPEPVASGASAAGPSASPRASSTRLAIQRLCTGCDEEMRRQPVEEPEEGAEQALQTKAMPGQTPRITPDLEARLAALRGGGAPLPPSERAFFEPRFGSDFGDVRVHTGGEGADLARRVEARAFTLGRSVVFGAGQYAPGTTAGRALLAHELTHVVQQSRASSAPVATRPMAVQRKREPHGVGGGLHTQVYEPAEAYWKQQLGSVETLARAWNAELPGLGYVGGVVAGAPTILAADLALILIYALELVTPLTEEEHFLVGATLGAGEVAIPVIHVGQRVIGALAPLFARRPGLAGKILPRIAEVARAVFQKLAGLLKRKAAVNPVSKTEPAIVDAFAKTAPQPLVGSGSRKMLVKAGEGLQEQVERLAMTLKGDEAARAAWRRAASHYPYWERVEAYLRIGNLSAAVRSTVRHWLSDIGSGGVPFERMRAAGLDWRVSDLILRMWDLGRTGKVFVNPG